MNNIMTLQNIHELLFDLKFELSRAIQCVINYNQITIMTDPSISVVGHSGLPRSSFMSGRQPAVIPRRRDLVDTSGYSSSSAHRYLKQH